ncbi:MAG: hypothetical protein AABZ06_11570 [Bdellovibrionota bacterium]
MPDDSFIKLRSQNSFGVAGALTEDTEIFHEALFSGKHIGLVSDLICAKTRLSKQREHRLRQILLHGIDGWYSIENTVTSALSTQLLLECGISRDKIAVSFSVVIPGTDKFELSAIREALEKNDLNSNLEKWVNEFRRCSDWLIVRAQEDMRRLEIVSINNIVNDEAAVGEQVLYVAINNPVKSVPQVRSYTELGDLDYPHLLRENRHTKTSKVEKHKPATMDVSSTNVLSNDEQLEEAVVIRGLESTIGVFDRILVKGGNEVGSLEHLYDEVVVEKARLQELTKRLRLELNRKPEEGSSYRSRYTLAQKQLITMKDENRMLKIRNEELKNQVISFQLAAKSRNLHNDPEYLTLKVKYERIIRLADELRKTNQQLIDRLSDQKDQKRDNRVFSQRSDAAIKLAAETTKELEQLQLRCDELKQEANRLRMELDHANKELKYFKSRGRSNNNNDSNAA